MEKTNEKTLIEVFNELQKDNYIKDLSLSTIQNYETFLKLFIQWCKERQVSKVCEVTRELIDDYKYVLRIKGIENTTLNSYLKSVRRLLNFSCERGYIEKSIKVILVKEFNTAKPTLAIDEAEKLFKNSDLSISSTLAILYLGTGIRSRTMCHLKVSDIDFDNKLLTCRVTKNRKTLILPLTGSLAELLRAYIEKHKKKSDDWLFVNAEGNQLKKTSMYTTLNKHYEKCGINKTGVHMLRHTFGKFMARNRCDAFTLQHWFGHNKVEESRKYVNLFASDLAASVEQVNPTAGLKFV